MIVKQAKVEDAEEILNLQRLAYESEVEVYNDYTIPPLTQTLKEIITDFEKQVFLKPSFEEKIIASVRASIKPSDMALPGYRLHKLSGKDKGKWSVWVNGSWRITFMFEGQNAVLLDYLDYH